MKKYALILLCFLAACHQPSSSHPPVTDEELRAEQEAQRRLIEEAAETGGTPRSWRSRPGMQKQFERVAERIEAAGAAMCKEMGLPRLKRRCYYYFDTSRDLDINAYADGEYIVIARGMLRFVRDDDELAVVMGHELAHNMMGHRKAKEENAIAGMLLGAVLDGVAVSQGASPGAGWQDTGTLVGAYSFSQSFELEADYVGLYIAARANYNIAKAPDFWRRMSLENPDGVYNSSTHPTHPERSVALAKAVDEIRTKRTARAPLVPNMQGQPIEGDYEAEYKIW